MRRTDMQDLCHSAHCVEQYFSFWFLSERLLLCQIRTFIFCGARHECFCFKNVQIYPVSIFSCHSDILCAHVLCRSVICSIWHGLGVAEIISFIQICANSQHIHITFAEIVHAILLLAVHILVHACVWLPAQHIHREDAQSCAVQSRSARKYLTCSYTCMCSVAVGCCQGLITIFRHISDVIDSSDSPRVRVMVVRKTVVQTRGIQIWVGGGLLMITLLAVEMLVVRTAGCRSPGFKVVLLLSLALKSFALLSGYQAIQHEVNQLKNNA